MLRKVLLIAIVAGIACVVPHPSASATAVSASDSNCIESAVRRASTVINNDDALLSLYKSLFDERAIIRKVAGRPFSTMSSHDQKSWLNTTRELVLKKFVPALRPYANVKIDFRSAQYLPKGVRKIIGVVGHGTNQRMEIVVFLTGTCTFVDIAAKGFSLSGRVSNRMKNNSSTRTHLR